MIRAKVRFYRCLVCKRALWMMMLDSTWTMYLSGYDGCIRHNGIRSKIIIR